MNKNKLKTKDGNELTVFYLGKPEVKQPSFVEEAIAQGYGDGFSSCDGSAPSPLPLADPSAMKWLFEQGLVKWGDQWGGTYSEKDKQEELKVEIDDTIESDFVKDPVIGRIYKVKSLERVVARLKALLYDENLNPDVEYARMDLHGTEFLIASEDLLKATKFEVEKYLQKDA